MNKMYLKIAFRNLWHHKAFAFINIMGLAVGMTAFFLIFLYVRFERSYDDFHTKADRIYRIVSAVKTPSETINTGLTTSPVAIGVKKEFPEVEDLGLLGLASYSTIQRTKEIVPGSAASSRVLLIRVASREAGVNGF